MEGSEGIMVQIKGIPILDTMKSSKQVFGEKEYERLVTLLSPEAKKIFQEGIVASNWYSLDVYSNLLDLIVKEKHQGDPLPLAKGSAKIMEKNFRGIYAIFIKLTSPEYFIKKVATFTQSMFKGVVIEIKTIDRNKIVVIYRGFQKQHAVFENIILGFYQKGLELSGAKNVKTKFTTSIAEGKGHSELTITWESKHIFG
jgi:hypothetical protein